MLLIVAPARHAIAAGDVGIRCVQIDLAGPTRAKRDHAGRLDRHAPRAHVEQVGPQHPVWDRWGQPAPSCDGVLGDEVHRDQAFHQFDIGLLGDGRQERADQLGPSQVIRVQDAPCAVATLAVQAVVSLTLGEVHPELDELANAVRTLPHRLFHGLALAQTGTCDKGVPNVRLGGVVGVPHGRDSPLGVGGI